MAELLSYIYILPVRPTPPYCLPLAAFQAIYGLGTMASLNLTHYREIGGSGSYRLILVSTGT